MKKFSACLSLILLIFLFFSCGNKNKEITDTDETLPDSGTTVIEDSDATDDDFDFDDDPEDPADNAPDKDTDSNDSSDSAPDKDTDSDTAPSTTPDNDTDTDSGSSSEGGACVPISCKGKICGSDGCVGKCGKGCGELACNADQTQCVDWECEKLEVDEFKMEPSSVINGYTANIKGKGIGSESIPDKLIIILNYKIEPGTVSLRNYYSNGINIILWEDYDDEPGKSTGKKFAQQSGTLTFTEIRQGTFESRGYGSFRLAETHVGEFDCCIPVAGGRCYEFENITWDTFCVPQCEGKVCGDDGCNESCGECGIDAYCKNDQSECIPYECETLTIDSSNISYTYNYASGYRLYTMAYTPNSGNPESSDKFTFQISNLDPVTGTYDLAGTNYADEKGIFIFVREDNYIKSYFQHKGTVQITDYDKETGRLTATLSGVRVTEVKIGQDYTTTPVYGGKCYNIADTTFTYTVE